MKKQFQSLLKFKSATIIFLLACIYIIFYIGKYSFFPIDDAYIHLRIARNVAEHGLPYFNINESIMGSSPHLWINLMALCLTIFNGSLDFLPYIEILFCIVTMFLCLYILKRRFSLAVSAALAFLIISVFILPSAAGLMETPLAIALFLGTVLSIQKHKLFAAGVFSGLALWMRCEYSVLIMLCLIVLFRDKNYRSYLIGMLVPVLGYVAYTLHYFNTLIPFPVIAKPLVYSINLIDFFTEQPSVMSYPFHWWKSFPQKNKAIVVATAELILFVSLIINYLKHRLLKFEKIMLLFSLLVFAIYTIRKVYIFSWYTPLYTVSFVLYALLRVQKKYSVFTSALFLVGFMNIFLIWGFDTYSFISQKEEYYDEYGTGLRVHQYLKIGSELYNKFPNSTLMTSEIGALGWSFKGKIIDGGSLVSPETLKYHPMKVPEDRRWNMAGSIPLGAVKELQPDIIVSIPLFAKTIYRGMANGEIRYKVTGTYPIIPPEESLKSGISTVWTYKSIDVFERY